MVESLFSNDARFQWNESPYPYLVIDGALSAPYYEELASSFPSLEQVTQTLDLPNNEIRLRGARSTQGDPKISPAWHEFIQYHSSPAFFAEFIKRWGDEIRRAFPGIEENFRRSLAEFDVGLRHPGKKDDQNNFQHDIVLDCLFAVHTPVTHSSPARGPHLDSARKLFSTLLYFRDPEDDCTGGEYEIYRASKPIRKRDRKDLPESSVERVATVPYKANTLVMWLNTGHAIHGVSPRSVTPIERRYIAVTGECYGGRRKGGFFATKPEWQKFDWIRDWFQRS